MADKLGKKERSDLMRKVKRSNTKPEVRLRKALWASGLRGYRLDFKGAPGRPDVAYTKWRLAIFVDGCFWHGCPQCYRRPASNQEYWDAKINRNKERDKNVNVRLREAGWTIERYWECEVKKDLDSCVNHIETCLKALQKKSS